jgi:pyruvate dehydrogenase (quinone)
MAKKKLADLLTKVLADAGVRRIYGVPGDSLNGITDSIRAEGHSMSSFETRRNGSFCSGSGGASYGNI